MHRPQIPSFKSLKPREIVKNLFRNLKHKYKFLVLDEVSLEEKFTFRLSRMNVFVAAGASGSIVAITNNSWVRDLNFTGFLGTFTAGTNTYNIAGSFTLVSDMLYTVSNNSTYNFVANTTGHTINLGPNPVNGVPQQIGNVVFNGVGGGWTLLTQLRCSASNITLVAGALNLNNNNANCDIWTCTGTGVRSIAFGSSGVVEAGGLGTVTLINFANLTNFSYTGTSRIFVAGNSTGTGTINIGTTGCTEANAMNVQIALGGGLRTFTFTNGSVIRDLNVAFLAGTFVPPSALTIFGSLTAGAAGTWTTGTGTITFASTSTGRTITTGGKILSNINFNGAGGGWTLQDAFTAANALTFTTGQITLNNFILTCDSFASNNNNVRTIQFGTGSINLAGVNFVVPFDMGTNGNGFSYTGSGVVNLNYAGTVARVVDTSSTFTESNALNFNITAGNYPLNVPSSSIFKDLNFTGFSGTFDLQGISIFGSLTFSPSMTVTSVNINTTNFAATSTGKTITSAGKKFYGVQFSGVGGGWALQDAMQLDDTLLLNNGTLTLNGFNVTTGYFNSTGTTTRAINFGSNFVNINGNRATVVNIANATNFTLVGTGGFTILNNGAGTDTRTINIGTTGGSAAIAPNIFSNNEVSTQNLAFTSGSWVQNLIFNGAVTVAPPAVLNITGSLTLYPSMIWTTGTGTINFVSTSTGRTITTAGKTLYNVTFNGVGGDWTMQDAFRASNTVTFTNGTINLASNTTSTVGSFVTLGTALKYLASSSSGVQATISQSTGTVTATYLSIKDSNATGGATFDALSLTNINDGNNTGWIFGFVPPSQNFLEINGVTITSGITIA
jgi:hypothetical protein